MNRATENVRIEPDRIRRHSLCARTNVCPLRPLVTINAKRANSAAARNASIRLKFATGNAIAPGVKTKKPRFAPDAPPGNSFATDNPSVGIDSAMGIARMDSWAVAMKTPTKRGVCVRIRSGIANDGSKRDSERESFCESSPTNVKLINPYV